MSNSFDDFDRNLQNSIVQSLDFEVFKKKNLSLHVKRDDLIHPFISGNKWRKLKHFLLDFEATKAQSITTFGGAYSNHLLATACAGAHFGIPTYGIVRGEELEPNSNHNLALCNQFGMRLSFISRSEYKAQKHRKGEHNGTYYIPEGGAGPEGMIGCGELLKELSQDYDHIFLACGTGTTYGGILNQVKKSQIATEVHGIVVLKNYFQMEEDIAKMLGNSDGISLFHDYHYGGFAKWDDNQIEFNKTFSSKTGILLDPIYTGKMIRGIFSLAERDYFKPEQKILAIHTGGLTGLFSEAFLKS